MVWAFSLIKKHKTVYSAANIILNIICNYHFFYIVAIDLALFIYVFSSIHNNKAYVLQIISFSYYNFPFLCYYKKKINQNQFYFFYLLSNQIAAIFSFFFGLLSFWCYCCCRCCWDTYSLLSFFCLVIRILCQFVILLFFISI